MIKLKKLEIASILSIQCMVLALLLFVPSYGFCSETLDQTQTVQVSMTDLVELNNTLMTAKQNLITAKTQLAESNQALKEAKTQLQVSQMTSTEAQSQLIEAKKQIAMLQNQLIHYSSYRITDIAIIDASSIGMASMISPFFTI